MAVHEALETQEAQTAKKSIKAAYKALEPQKAQEAQAAEQSGYIHMGAKLGADPVPSVLLGLAPGLPAPAGQPLPWSSPEGQIAATGQQWELQPIYARAGQSSQPARPKTHALRHDLGYNLGVENDGVVDKVIDSLIIDGSKDDEVGALKQELMQAREEIAWLNDDNLKGQNIARGDSGESSASIDKSLQGFVEDWAGSERSISSTEADGPEYVYRQRARRHRPCLAH